MDRLINPTSSCQVCCRGPVGDITWETKAMTLMKVITVDPVTRHVHGPHLSHLIIVLPRLLVDEVLPALLGVRHPDGLGGVDVVGEGRGRR